MDPVVAPSGFSGGQPGGPSLAISKYNPRTGEYQGQDGRLYKQANLTTKVTSWQDMMPI